MTGDMAAMLIDSGMEPFIPLSTDAGIFVTQVCLVLILAAVAVIYPTLKISKLKLTTR
jgi:ABC-type lipoprotein release transport system permease subunit